MSSSHLYVPQIRVYKKDIVYIYMDKRYIDLETLNFRNFMITQHNKIKKLINKLETSNNLKNNDKYDNLLIDELIYENSIKKCNYLVDNGLLLNDEDDNEDTIKKIHKEWLLYEIELKKIN
jgi:hypothetical protein